MTHTLTLELQAGDSLVITGSENLNDITATALIEWLKQNYDIIEPDPDLDRDPER